MRTSPWWFRAAILVASAFWLAPPWGAFAEPIGRNGEVPVADEARPDPALQAFADEFDQSVLGGTGPPAATAVRRRLDAVIAKRVTAIDRVCGLSEEQKQKLELAGRGDIKRLFDRIDSLRRKFQTIRREGADSNVPNAIYAEVSTVRGILRSGPFGDESLFAKTQKTILTTDQAAKFERRRQLAAQSTKKITAGNVGALENIDRLRKDVYRIVWNRTGSEVGLLEFDKSVDIYSGSDFRRLRTFGEGRKLVAFDFSPQKDVLAIGENSRQAFLINQASGAETVLETGNPQPSVKFSPDGKLLATGGYGTRATLWSAATGERLHDLDAGPEGGLTPEFSPDGTILAIGNRNGATRLYDVATARLRLELPLKMSHELKFDPAGKRLAVVYVDGSLAVWNVESGQLLQRVKSRGEELYSVDWSSDGSVLASAGRDAFVTLWNATDLTVLNEIECAEWVISVQFNPDGTRLIFAGGTVTGSAERYVETWAVP